MFEAHTKQTSNMLEALIVIHSAAITVSLISWMLRAALLFSRNPSRPEASRPGAFGRTSSFEGERTLSLAALLRPSRRCARFSPGFPVPENWRRRNGPRAARRQTPDPTPLAELEAPFLPPLSSRGVRCAARPSIIEGCAER